MANENVNLTWIKYLGHWEKSELQMFRNDASQKESLESLTTSYFPEIAVFEMAHIWDIVFAQLDKCVSPKMGQTRKSL